MPRGVLIVGLMSSLCLCLEVSQARAGSGDALEMAEQAYREVDFHSQLAEARRALEAGGNDPERLGRVYRLIGIAHAALDDRELARQAFLRLLALQPGAELDRSLSPRLRSPYLEARGYWDVASVRLGVDILTAGQEPGYGLGLRDPLGMVTRWRVRSLGPDSAIVVVEAPASPSIVVTAPELEAHSGRRLQVQLLDEHGNVLVERALPDPASRSRREARQQPLPGERPAAGESPSAGLGYPSVLLGGISLGTLGIGVFAHVVRENKASEWNGAGCERSGLGSRGDQCAEVNAARTRAQRVAIASYSTAGALLIAAVVLHLAEPGAQAPDAGALACGAGPGSFGVACNAWW